MLLWETRPIWVSFPRQLSLKGVEKPQEIRLTFNM